MEREHNLINEGIECEHKEINEKVLNVVSTVQEIRTRQEQEFKLQKRICDTVPDAEAIKDGIETRFRENAQLREAITRIGKEVSLLNEKNQKMRKEIRTERGRSQDFER